MRNCDGASQEGIEVKRQVWGRKSQTRQLHMRLAQSAHESDSGCQLRTDRSSSALLASPSVEKTGVTETRGERGVKKTRENPTMQERKGKTRGDDRQQENFEKRIRRKEHKAIARKCSRHSTDAIGQAFSSYDSEKTPRTRPTEKLCLTNESAFSKKSGQNRKFKSQG